MSEKSLYERLGGVFAIAAVVDHFSDAVVKDPIVGQKSKIRNWRNGTPRTSEKITRSQVHANAVGLQRFGWALPIHCHQARQDARSASRRPTGIPEFPPAEFDEVAAELGRTLDFFKVSKREKDRSSSCLRRS